MRKCSAPMALAVAALAVLMAGHAAALDLTLDLSAQSAFIWRGMVLNDKPVFQPSLTIDHGGLAGTVWLSADLKDDHGYKNQVNEIDYILAYTQSLKNVDLTFTAYEYTLPHTGAPSTTELWGAVAWRTLFTPTLTVVRDIKVIDGWYFLLTASHNLGLLKPSVSDGLLLTVNLGHGTKEYAHGYFPDIEHDHVTDYGVRLDCPFTLGKGTLKLNLQLTSFTDPHVYTPGYEGKRSNLAGGLAYSIQL